MESLICRIVFVFKMESGNRGERRRVQKREAYRKEKNKERGEKLISKSENEAKWKRKKKCSEKFCAYSIYMYIYIQ